MSHVHLPSPSAQEAERRAYLAEQCVEERLAHAVAQLGVERPRENVLGRLAELLTLPYPPPSPQPPAYPPCDFFTIGGDGRLEFHFRAGLSGSMLTPILYCPQYCRNVSFVDNVVAALMFCTLGDILPAQDEGRVFWVVSAHRPSQGGSRIIPLETTLWDVIKGDDTAPYLFTELIGGAPKPKTPPVDHRSPYRTRHAAGRESMETHLDASTTPTSTPLPSAPPLVQLQAATTPHYHDDGDDHDDNNDEDNGDQAVNDDEVRLEVPYCVEKTPEERMNDAQQLLGVGFNLP